MIEFIKKSDCDERSKFANDVCQLLVDASDKSIITSLERIEEVYNHFEEHVRNVYELIDSEIPLFRLYDLVRLDKDNWGYSEAEYKTNKQIALKACVSYYKVSLQSVIEWEENNL